jgi:peptide/nickel transport system substrate-binding protein
VRHVHRLLLYVAAIAALGVAAGVAWSSNSKSSSAGAAKGGTYRVGWESAFGFTDAFDPTGEYLADAQAIYGNLMLRNLVTYPHRSGAAGTKLVPDIATSLPKPTNRGKTYTFHLKTGVKFGPPVDRAVTSKDFVYALERLAKPANGGQYAFYYTIIKGWDAYAAGKAKSISGISTPNAQTIVFNLTGPAGDFLFRMAMPATAPIPHEVADCFKGTSANQYGRDVVSTGPYMIDGADKVDTSSCKALKPMSGYDGQTTLTLVRNPSYAPSTDSKIDREALPDEFVFTVDANADDISARIQAGELDDNEITAAPKTIRQYVTSSSLKKLIHFNTSPFTYYLTMNLTQPPFDDIHVRKAMNLIMDKQGLRQAWGGPVSGSIATHIVPDAMLSNLLEGFDPYRTPNNSGSVAKAMAEMKQSKYDTNHDGKCDASACKSILMIADNRIFDKSMVPIVQASAAKIGLTFDVRSVNGAYPVIQTPSRNVPISERPRWGADYPDALTFFQALFTSSAIIKSGNTNYSLVGITPAIAKQVGAKGTLTGIPSVDADFNHCAALVGTPRVQCWANLDRKLMTQVVPWVPYLWASFVHTISKNVTKWDFDQSFAATAFAHVAVKS